MIEKIAWKGWPNCYRLTNGEVELIVTADVGPRVMRYAYVGGENLFLEIAGELGGTNEPTWKLRGGSRLWVGPEDSSPRTYAVDNAPCEVHKVGGVLTVTSPVEPASGLQKRISLKLGRKGSKVEVVHSLHNAGRKAQRLAPWVLSMMRPGGYGITGFPPRGTHPEVLQPTNPLVMWAFSDLSDKRWRYSSKYLVLKQDPKQRSPQKLGLFNPKTWGAYLWRDTLFVKQYTADPAGTYPDMGCSYETFTNADVLEIETLGPMTKLNSGDWLHHTEQWSLHRGVLVPRWDDATLDGVLQPLLG
ncbi:MAG: hypothetical protein JNK48_11710 [Bryobacterales bacterium]|nr:hypothetical protein [Bryobacterales bacterium]